MKNFLATLQPLPSAGTCGASAPTRGGDVLLVEDDAELARELREELAAAGHRCEHVMGREAARRAFARGRHNVIVVEACLRDGDGLQLAAELARERAVPVIAVTAEADARALWAAMQLRVFAFLVKPLDVEQFAREVSRAVDLDRVRASIATSVERVQGWRAELTAFESGLSAGGVAQPAEALLALTTRQLMEGMAELRLQVAARLAAGAGAQEAARSALDGTRPVVLVEAIRETIAVLERTKDAFRSRELGELRARLMHLLAETPEPKIPLNRGRVQPIS